jgi:hypothetical protein
LTVKVMVVEAVMEEDAVSVPVMVTVYEPLVAKAVPVEVVEEEEPALEQPDRAAAMAAKRKMAQKGTQRRGRKRSKPTNRRPMNANVVPGTSLAACVTVPREANTSLEKEAGGTSRETEGAAPDWCWLPGVWMTAALAQVETLVNTVSVTATALALDIVAFGNKKQALVMAGLADTENPIEPV